MRKPWHIDRRSFLRGAGLAVSIPLLEAMAPVVQGAGSTTPAPTRLLCIGVHLGFHAPDFFPNQAGADYKLPPLLKPLQSFRDEFTVFSGLDHEGVGKGHPATVNFLTGCEKPRDRKQMSFDQVAARHVGSQTRFASLQLEARSNDQKGKHLSWGVGGIPLPLADDPRGIFERLFARPRDPARQKESLANAQSVLDHVLEDARSLQRKLGSQDQQKLDEYLQAIRDVELDIQKAERFLKDPGSAIAQSLEIPDRERLSVTECSRVMYKLIALGFQADLSRVATFRIPGENHPVSHHGQKQAKVKTFVAIQQGYMDEFAGLLRMLKTTRDAGGGNLLDNTLVLLGSGMGNASTHSTRNLPILLAGGGFQHRGHVKFGRKRKPPLCNLYVSMLQRMGLETDQFSQSRGNLNDLLT